MIQNPRAARLPLWAGCLLLFVLAAAARASVPEPYLAPTPELRAAVAEAVAIGQALYVRHGMLRAAEAALERTETADGWIGTLIDADPISPRVRFISERGGRLVAAAEVALDPTNGRATDPLVPTEPVELATREAATIRALQTALSANPLNCDLRVDTFVPRPTEAGPIEVFLIADPAREGVVALGGHTRVEISEDGTEALSVRPLSKTCGTVDRTEIPEGAETRYLLANHLLTSAPTAIHVFLSLRHGTPLVVMTSEGVWMSAVGVIGFLADASEGTDPARCAQIVEESNLAWAGVIPPTAPHWRGRLVFSGPIGEPWRSDPRLSRYFAPGYPDDVQVAFLNYDDLQKSEAMWVRLFDHDPERDLYLGAVINEPHFLTTPRQQENVVVRFDTDSGMPTAVDSGGDYSVPGRPDGAAEGFGAQVYEGLRHLRLSENGNVTEPLDRCREVLSQAIREAPEAEIEWRFLAHYLHGRCLAETYDTDEAIVQFQRALALRPDNVDANMALLAEYSVKLWSVEDGPGALVERDRRDGEFQAQVAHVRACCGGDERVNRFLTMIFDPRTDPGADELSPEELERRRHVGFGVFRWKIP